MKQQLQITLPEDTVTLINQWVKNSPIIIVFAPQLIAFSIA